MSADRLPAVALQVAALIPGARTVQLPGDDSPIWANDEVAPEVERFLTVG